jgi:alkylhydroperoxidase/carboxymuconolactone decarboxylase family protein YurZ
MTAAKLPIEELRQQLALAGAQSQSADGHESAYRELIGFVPPCCDRRDATALETMLRCMHEQMRIRKLITDSVDAKTAQLILLAMLLADHGAAVVAQGVAARRAGASWHELRALIGMAFLLHGLPAANCGDEFLTAFAEREHEERIAGAVAAHG